MVGLRLKQTRKHAKQKRKADNTNAHCRLRQKEQTA
jgi:hypothetical protein